MKTGCGRALARRKIRDASAEERATIVSILKFLPVSGYHTLSLYLYSIYFFRYYIVFKELFHDTNLFVWIFSEMVRRSETSSKKRLPQWHTKITATSTHTVVVSCARTQLSVPQGSNAYPRSRVQPRLPLSYHPFFSFS